MDELKPKPCHWCGKDAESHLSGSYVDGWRAYVGCKDYFCSARGPFVMTEGMSNDEYKTRDEAIRRWNMIGLPLTTIVSDTKIKCPRCKGTGKIEAMSFGKSGGSLENSCHICKGRGWLK